MAQGKYADRPLATATRQYETERVIVTEWRFPPGGHTGWHTHAYDYVVVPLTTGTLLVETADEEFAGEMTVGGSYGRPAGASHDVINNNDVEFAFIEIELLP